MTDALIELLTEDEGVRLKVYDDATGLAIGPGSVVRGHPTIGIGRCLDRNGVTLEEARYLLANDVALVKAQLNALAWFSVLDRPRQVVLLSMGFQMGAQAVLSFHDMLGWMKVGRWDKASQAMLASKWAEQTPRRVRRLAAVMRTGVLPDLGGQA